MNLLELIGIIFIIAIAVNIIIAFKIDVHGKRSDLFRRKI